MNINDPEDIDLNPPLFPNGWDTMDFNEQRKSQYFGEYASTPFAELVTSQDDLIQNNKTLAARVSFQVICDKMENEIQKLRDENENRNQDDAYMYESEDSYMADVYQDTIPTPINHYEYHHVNTWVSCLRYNYIFDSGISESHTSLKEIDASCLCPCSTTMKFWREQFGLNFMKENDCCKGKKLYSPTGLVDHLRNKGNSGCLLHLASYEYLKKLYASQTNFFQERNSNVRRRPKKKEEEQEEEKYRLTRSI